MKVYGIKNCNPVKRVLEFLDKKALEFNFIDTRKTDLGVLESWLKYKRFSEIIDITGIISEELGLNKGKIRSLSEFELKNTTLENPSYIKHPVTKKDNQIYIGREHERVLRFYLLKDDSSFQP